MLYQLAIVQRPTAEEYANGANEALVYGPINVLSRHGDYPQLTGLIVAEAAAKLGSGFVWNDRMVVMGLSFHTYD